MREIIDDAIHIDFGKRGFQIAPIFASWQVVAYSLRQSSVVFTHERFELLLAGRDSVS